MTTTIHLTITIRAPRARVFAAITDLASYTTWLPPSSAFKGTTRISGSRVELGTTYVETGPLGVRHGEVVEFEPPAKVAFHQPMTFKPAVVGLVLDVRVEMTLSEEEEAEEGGTILKRDITLGIPWVMRPFKAVVEKQFRDESWRTMGLLKAYLEKEP